MNNHERKNLDTAAAQVYDLIKREAVLNSRVQRADYRLRADLKTKFDAGEVIADVCQQLDMRKQADVLRAVEARVAYAMRAEGHTADPKQKPPTLASRIARSLLDDYEFTWDGKQWRAYDIQKPISPFSFRNMVRGVAAQIANIDPSEKTIKQVPVELARIMDERGRGDTPRMKGTEQ